MENDSTALDRVQELTWAMLDEQLTDDEMSLLDTLLLSDDQARARYIECIQLHTDLTARFAAPQTAAAAKGSTMPPVLGCLSEGLPQFGASSADVTQ